jgi:hypothetical protein
MTRRWRSVQPYFGLTMLAGSAGLLAAGAPFMKTWFYCFAWWSLLLVLDGVNARRTGASFFFDAGREFLFSAFLSVPAWLVFELFNLRLRNWSYHALPPSLPERWAGYFIAFATVIPALKILARLIRSLGVKAIRFRRKLTVTPALLCFCLVSGLASLALALIWPRQFFPLVWLGFIFLIEPLNYSRRRPSLLRGLEEGDATLLVVWMLAGLAAGIFWELLNFWAGSHWEYHIPYLNFGRIFQMPVFGFGGFPPFALEIFAIDALAAGIYGRLKARPGFRAAFWALLLAIDLVSFYLIDIMTVVQ